MAETAPIKQKFIIEVDGEGQIKAYTEDLKKNEKAVESNSGAQSAMATSLKRAAIAFGAVAVAMKGAKLAYEYAELGGKVDVVNTSFNKFARDGGQNAIAMLSDLRKASGGMMNDMVLQQTAMKGMISGIKFDDMIVAMEYVRKYSIATGSDFESKMQTVMTGLSRGSAEFMDDVGIIVKGTGDVVGKTIDQMRDKMGQFSDTTDSTSSQIAKMKTQFETLKQDIGTEIAPAFGMLAERATEFMKVFDGDKIKGFLDFYAKMLNLNPMMMLYKKIGLVGEIELKTIDQVQQAWEESNAKLNKMSEDLDKKKTASSIAGLKKKYDKEFRLNEELENKLNILKAKMDSDTIKKDPEKKDPEKQSSKVKEAAIKAEQERLEARKTILNHEIDMHDKYISDYIIDEQEMGKKLNEDYNKTLAEKKKIAMSASIQRDDADNYDVRDLEELGRIPISEHWIKEEQAIAQAKDSIINSAMSIGNSVVSISNSIASAKMREIDSQIAAVKASNMSDKQKEASIKSLEAKRRDEMRKSAIAGMIMAQANAGVTLFSTIGAVQEASAKAMADGIARTPLMRIASGLAVGAAGAGFIATAIQQQKNIQNAGKFYYGSKDSSGAYQEIGGNGASDNITANVRSGELIVKAGEDARRAKQALNGGSGGMQSINFGGISVAISGNADESVISQIPAMIERGVVNVIEKARFTNSFNPALRSR